MLLFLIIPAWLLCLLVAAGLACFPGPRRAATYLASISTGATLVSLIVSTAVLYLAPKLGLDLLGKWAGIALIVAYILAVILGGLVGSFAGFFLTRSLGSH